MILVTQQAVSAVIKLSSPATREFWGIPVLFEDEHLLALDKPSGLLTSPDRHDDQQPSLMTLLHDAICENKPWAYERGLTYLMNAHRLDVETSGILLLAKNKPALVRLANLFGSEQPLRRYVALAAGAGADDRFEVDAKLAPHPTRAGFVRIDSRHGKKSKTRFLVLERFSGYTLVQCEPLTERPHQIRVHLRHAGMPIVGDALYGGRLLFLSALKRDYHAKQGEPERPLIGRPALHAEHLELPHPVSNETVKITSPWPKDFTVAVKYLRRFGG